MNGTSDENIIYKVDKEVGDQNSRTCGKITEMRVVESST